MTCVDALIRPAGPAPHDTASHVGSVDGSFHNGPISSFNAWFFSAFEGYINHISRRHKKAAFSYVSGDVVVELGAGTGANFGFLRRGTVVHAVEPRRAMHDRLREAADEAGVELHIQPSGAERLDLPDASVDEVICSLVLCTVDDPQAVVAEVLRVLRPGGRFRFVEHVAAPDGIRAVVQRAIRRPWGWLFEGCDPHRRTPELIEAAGFSSVEIQRRRFRQSMFWPVNTAAWGIATR